MSGLPEFKDDPEALALARRLEGTDFSVESKARASLRARLLRRQRGEQPRPAAPHARLALALAAAAVLLLAPLRGRLKDLVGRTAKGRAELALPTLSGAIPVEASARAESPFVTAEGRVVQGPDRRTVVWELEGRAFVLESRRITAADLFEVPTL